MAQRRMFSPDIVNSDAFLEMPTSTQALYFQLGMKADDDGFVNPRMVMRMIGSSDDELKVLMGKRFVLPFENGVLVIKHWRINNLVRKDWYKPTIYRDEKKRLFVKDNGGYTFDEEKGVPLVNEPLTQVRLGKVNTSVAGAPQIVEVYEPEVDESRPPSKKKYPNAPVVFSWFPSRESSWSLNTTELKHAELLFVRGERKVKSILSYVAKHREDDYFPKVNKPSDLERKWNDIIDYADKND